MTDTFDCRGVAIEPGDEVVAAGLGGRLHTYVVRCIEAPGKPNWWRNVRFEGGGYTTPDRVAVVHKHG